MNLLRFCRLASALCFAMTGVAFATQTFNVCYNFSCRASSLVTLNAQEWQSVVEIFDAETAREEREQIKLAIAKMEHLAGLYSPTHRDVALNLPITDEETERKMFPGQQDCIDESINTTAYVRMFQQAGLLQFHRPLDRAYRRTVWDQHWAAEIEDMESTQRYVIDSWFRDNGEEPYLVTSESWYDLSQ